MTHIDIWVIYGFMKNNNTEKDSAGCLLVGENKVVGKVINSKITFEKLMKEYLTPCKKNKEKVTIEIIRKYKG